MVGGQGELDSLLLGGLHSPQLTHGLGVQVGELPDGADAVLFEVLLQDLGPLAGGEVVEDTGYVILEVK